MSTLPPNQYMPDSETNPDASKWAQNAGQQQQTNKSQYANMTPDALRQLAKQQSWSEDFDRFSNGQLQQWLNKYWDPNQGKFRSQHAGVTGFFEKPTECPNGSTPFGSKENAQCLPNNDPRLYPVGNGGGDGGVNPQQQQQNTTTFGQAGALGNTGNAMTDMLVNQFNTKQNSAGGSNMFGLLGGKTAGQWKDASGNVTTPGQGTQQQADVSGKLLKGGGLWWTDTDQAKNVFGKKPTAMAPTTTQQY
jgi:hypothetical protein